MNDPDRFKFNVTICIRLVLHGTSSSGLFFLQMSYAHAHIFPATYALDPTSSPFLVVVLLRVFFLMTGHFYVVSARC